MKIYSERIGPVEYFTSIGFVCFLLPYGWGIPKYWPVCIAGTFAALYWLRRSVKKEEGTLRAAKSSDPRIASIVTKFGVLVITNAIAIRYL